MFITERPIVLADFFSAKAPKDCGASVFFVGHVRNHHQGKKVKRLFYECYEPMAQKEIKKIIESVKAKTGVRHIRLIHRVGSLGVGEIAVAICASGAHRHEAFEACREVIDRVKEEVPIWKKEIYEDSTHDWVVCNHNTKRRVSHGKNRKTHHGLF